MKLTAAGQIVLLVTIVLSGIHSSFGQVKALDGETISAEKLDRFIKTKMDSLKLPGLSVAVINDGKIVYHRALGWANIDSNKKVDDSTMFEAASLSKTTFAFLVMKLAEEGKIDLDKPLYKYLPNPDIDYDDRYKLITARMCLDHTTGFPNWRSDTKGVQLYIQFTPGTKYSYSGEGYEYLANVVAHIMHINLKNLGRLYTQQVGLPLGLKHFYFTWNDFLEQHKATGYYAGHPTPRWRPVIFRAASSLHTEAGDYARFLIAVMNNKGLKRATFDEMLKEQISIPNDTVGSHDAFGLGFYMEPTKYGTRYAHNGSNGDFTSGFIFYRKQKFGYVFFTNCENGGEFNKALRSFLIGSK
jgi:CubicO group peptidase (beta-lactamase class C family)